MHEAAKPAKKTSTDPPGILGGWEMTAREVAGVMGMTVDQVHRLRKRGVLVATRSQHRRGVEWRFVSTDVSLVHRASIKLESWQHNPSSR